MITIQWIGQLGKLIALSTGSEIHPVDSAIQPLNNRGQVYRRYSAKFSPQDLIEYSVLLFQTE